LPELETDRPNDNGPASGIRAQKDFPYSSQLAWTARGPLPIQITLHLKGAPTHKLGLYPPIHAIRRRKIRVSVLKIRPLPPIIWKVNLFFAAAVRTDLRLIEGNERRHR
jgi:hypothetical protein